MIGRFNKTAGNENLDRMSMSEVLMEIPWPSDWCLEALLDRIVKRQEERSR